ncbi:hypothetical protein [Microbacterium lacticum]
MNAGASQRANATASAALTSPLPIVRAIDDGWRSGCRTAATRRSVRTCTPTGNDRSARASRSTLRRSAG